MGSKKTKNSCNIEQSKACDQEHREISHMSQSTETKREFDHPTRSSKRQSNSDNSTYRFDPYLSTIFEGEKRQENDGGPDITQDKTVKRGIANIQDVEYMTEINTSLSFGPQSGLQPLTHWCSSMEECVLGATAESDEGEPGLGAKCAIEIRSPRPIR